MAAKTKICRKCGQRRPLDAYVSAAGTVCERCKRKGTRRTSRALHLRQTYGITLDEYEEIEQAQGKTCAGCGGKRGYNLHVDHDHQKEQKALAGGATPQEAARQSVRGLLCRRCNGILRDARDNPSIFAALYEYLAYPPAWSVLK